MKTIKTTWTRPSGDASTLARRILAQTHTLIAGTTGSGKSVLLRSIIHTALLDYHRFFDLIRRFHVIPPPIPPRPFPPAWACGASRGNTCCSK